MEARFFGVMEITLHGRPILALRTDKVRALLAYLLVENQHPHTREALAGLLWEDQPTDSAMHSLRQALSTLRKALGDDQLQPADVPCLLIVNDTVQWNPAKHIHVDVHEFTRRIGDLLASHRRANRRINLRQLRAAIAFYRGPFLASFSLPDSSAFDEWLLLMRESTNQQAIQAMELLLEILERRGEYGEAARLAEQLLALAPWDETLHSERMRLLAMEGKWSAAMAQYAACRRYLQEQLGLEPSAETIALVEQIRRHAARNQPLPLRFPQSPLDLPVFSTPFTGRERELEEIAAAIAQPHCRMLTLLGPGGIGKTRLAVEAAGEQAGIFPDGIFFIPFHAVARCDQIPLTIADALHLEITPGEVPLIALRRALANRAMLLVLDNFDHLAAGALCLAELLQSAPRLILLATSRTRLNLQEEWIYPVEGLDYPAEGQESTRQLEETSAGRLLMDSARRMGRRTLLDDDETAAAIRICQLVEGTPLSLELAASASRGRSFASLAADLSRTMDALSTELVNVPARHRSLRATIDHTWSLLEPAEQELFASLGVFHGGFTEAAAMQVANTNAAQIQALADHFLVRQAGGGRYYLHESLRQYAAEKLALDPAREQDIRNRHSEATLGSLAACEEQLDSPDQPRILAELAPDQDNIRQAWIHAVQSNHQEVLNHSLQAVYLFHDLRSRYAEGVELADMALELPDAPVLQARLHNRRGILLIRLSHYEEASQSFQAAASLLQGSEVYDEQALSLMWQANLARKIKSNLEAQNLAQEALKLARTHHLTRQEASALYFLGIIHSNMRNLEEAHACLQEGLALARQLEKPGLIASCLNVMADLDCAEGEYHSALATYSECLEISRKLGNRYNIAMHLNNLGTVHHLMGDYASAGELYRESLALCREIGDVNGEAVALANLGELAVLAEDYREAEGSFRQALEIGRRTEDITSIVVSLVNLGQALTRLGRMDAALGTLGEALDLSRQTQMYNNHAQAVLFLGEWAEQKQQAGKANLLARLALAHPALEEHYQQPARDLVQRTGGEPNSPLPPLDDVVDQILSGKFWTTP